MRQNFNPNARRQFWVSSISNKGSREQWELIKRANSFGEGYQPFEKQVEEELQPKIIQESEPESECEKQMFRGDNFLIVHLKAHTRETGKKFNSFR